MSTELVLRFGYGAIVPWVTRLDDGTLRAVAGPDMRIPRPLAIRNISMMFSRFSSLHSSIGKKAPINQCGIGGSPPMRWPVSAHASSNWLDAQRNSFGRSLGI
jgi:hypothetical protein